MTVIFPGKRGPKTKRHSAVNGSSRFEAEIKAEIEYNGIIGTEKAERIPYTKNHNYIPDFQLPNGIRLEVKGFFPPEDRSKMLAVKECNPDLDIRFIFLRPSTKINKDSNTTYSMWAEKHGFPWAGKHLPIEWLYEKKEAVTPEKN